MLLLIYPNVNHIRVKIKKYKSCTSDRLMSNMGHNHEIYGPQIEVVQNELQEG